MKVFVVGAGTMGSGIAQAFAQGGWEVGMYDVAEGFARKSLSGMLGRLAKQVEKGKLSQEECDRISGSLKVYEDLAGASDCDLVLEAVVERMEVKKSLFKELDSICADTAIFASNTSSLSITEMASATKNPGRVIGMHFFNPAPVMKLVEIIRGQLADEETFKRAVEYAKTIGKDPVEVTEGPGFVVNRILIPMINEAIGVLADGFASAEDIDKAMKLGANHPMGPLALSDLIGNDITLAIMEVLHKEMGTDKYAPHPLLRKMVRAGLLGKKTGRGFYQY
ncbi:3-hydroxybutyryl-CoA dehydrogenase [Youngiibacter fragilis]|uniref:3-hydroxybutyryl-CoA dehydrogenase n=1 Tax=Youngiibacter fragilis 232.1 TaxID=994573 RepID=V7I7T7_9CLOT|nr:3-hydroxybutyryl-CoA dehydrogenase [Youngiibacter fragilis]ETA81336.1 3-hydroxybutyryl-CoA dehydrogenase [Youngiibacter fragilis 232.1]